MADKKVELCTHLFNCPDCKSFAKFAGDEVLRLEAQVKELEDILQTYRIEAVEKAVNEKLKARQILGEGDK